MKQVWRDGVLKATYFYTPEGIRYKKVLYEGGVPVETVYSLNGVYEETQNSSGSHQMNYYYVNGELVMRRGGGSKLVIILL